jgi:hypothetical protein
MTGEWAAGLEATALASALRGSVWAYPLVNAGHLFGVALLVGGILPLDLRLLGMWPSLALPPLWRVLTRTASVGLVLAIFCGALLFICRAAAYAQSSLFILKMGVVAVGGVNAAFLHWTLPRELRRDSGLPTAVLPRTRAAAAVSLAAWLSALVLGRLVGYF